MDEIQRIRTFGIVPENDDPNELEGQLSLAIQAAVRIACDYETKKEALEQSGNYTDDGLAEQLAIERVMADGELAKVEADLEGYFRPQREQLLDSVTVDVSAADTNIELRRTIQRDQLSRLDEAKRASVLMEAADSGAAETVALFANAPSWQRLVDPVLVEEARQRLNERANPEGAARAREVNHLVEQLESTIHNARGLLSSAPVEEALVAISEL